MNLQDWNEALFQHLVKDVGRPGDPLYFYVDDHVLAQISGIDDPDEALADFIEAYGRTSFDDAFRLAVRWKSGKFVGVPPFLTTLAMTVLAVTLEPLGASSNNVYRRQRALLGLGGAGRGIPEGYDQMRSVWGIWNEWLDRGEGRQYGTSTAKQGSYSNQGYARSQAFLRHGDKQDIYAFFQSEGASIPADASGADLVAALSSWAQQQSSAVRLAEVCANRGLRDELATMLAAVRAFWDEEQGACGKPQHLEAVPLWEPGYGGPESGELSLVVPLASLSGTIGAKLLDLDQVEHEVADSDAYFYLTAEQSLPDSWLGEPIEGWKLTEHWTVSWQPPVDGTYFFVKDLRGQSWAGVQDIDSATENMVLVGPQETSQLPEQLALRLGGDQDMWSLVDSPGDGYWWLAFDGEAFIPGKALAPLFGKDSPARPARNHRLVGGLRLNGNAFLNGFEPDIRVTADAMQQARSIGEEPRVVLDGERLRDGLIDGTTGEMIYRLESQTLDPGDHSIEVTVGDSSNHSNIRSQTPSGAVLPAPLDSRHVRDHIVRFSLERNRSPQILMIDQDHKVFELAPSPENRYWLKILREAGGDFPLFERFFDSSWLDWIFPLPGQKAERLVFAVRSAPDKTWKILERKGSFRSLMQSSRVKSIRDASSHQLMQLLGGSNEYRFVDGDLTRFMLATRRESSRQISREQGARATQKREIDAARPPVAREARADVTDEPMLNPYEWLLWWLTEKGEEGALSSTVKGAFEWLCDLAGFPDTPDFTQTIRDLEALGYVARAGSKIFVRPANATWLPDSEALCAIGGERRQGLIGVLASGEGADTAEQDAALQAVDVHDVVQTREHPKDGTKVLPIAPRTIFVQLGSRSRSPGQQARELGLQFFDPSIRELESFRNLRDSLLDPDKRVSAESLKGDVRRFVPTDGLPGGRWKPLDGTLSSLASDTFLRASVTGGRKYLWWSAEEQRLTDCGWVSGLWGFHQGTPTQTLFGVVPRKDRFAVWDALPLPPRLEEFLVMRSGLLPRVGIERPGRQSRPVSQRQRPDPEPKQWRVYTNVPVSVASVVSRKMGHIWSRSKQDWAAELEDLEFR